MSLAKPRIRERLTKSLEQLEFDNIYGTLPEIFFSRHRPEPLKNQFHVHFNERAATLIELDNEQGKRKDFLDILTGINPWESTDPIAMCYTGHQFGQFVPRLGDGRATIGSGQNQ